jgi:hypothetical protein
MHASPGSWKCWRCVKDWLGPLLDSVTTWLSKLRESVDGMQLAGSNSVQGGMQLL